MEPKILFCTLLLAGAGCRGDGPVSPLLIEPQCVRPAPLVLHHGENAVSNNYGVLYHPDVGNPEAVTAALEAKYRFEARISWQGGGVEFGGGFAAALNPVRVALLRCEPAVKLIEQEVYVYIDD